MSNLMVRLLLSILLIPLAVVLFIVVGVATEDSLRPLNFITAGVVTWAFVAVYWTALWWDTVRWTGRRLGGTFLVAVISTLASIALFAGLRATTGDREFCRIMGSVTAPLLWLVGTVIIWRESRTERTERLRSGGSNVLVCPSCGYNLTGLREARCPECGKQMTLDELVASQPRDSSVELAES